MRRYLRPIAVGSVLTLVALTGHASAVVPAAIARAFWHDLDLAAAGPQAASGGGQGGQSRQAGRGSPPAPEGQPAQQNPPDGQNPPAEQPPATPLFRTGIDFVRVDVIASDRNGNAITDLKQTDFEVSEDGKPQNVETF